MFHKLKAAAAAAAASTAKQNEKKIIKARGGKNTEKKAPFRLQSGKRSPQKMAVAHTKQKLGHKTLQNCGSEPENKAATAKKKTTEAAHKKCE